MNPAREKIKNITNDIENDVFSPGDHISYALKGVYCIDRIEMLTIAGVTTQYYVLSHIFNKAIHKTFVPTKRAAEMGLRLPVSKKTFLKLEQIVESLDLEPEKLDINSNKKIKAYGDRIIKYGFLELLHAYFCVLYDISQMKRGEKRYAQFKDRLMSSICEEMSLVTGDPLDICHERLKIISKKYKFSH